MPDKPSEREEEYIARQEYVRLRKAQEAKQNQLKEDEKTKLKDLHYMCCPKCGMSLVEIKYKNIEIDKCTGCQGVWLDAGELETVSAMEKGGLDKLFSVFRK